MLPFEHPVWILIELTSFRYSRLEEALRWWFSCKRLLEGLPWRKEGEQQRAGEAAKQVCGLSRCSCYLLLHTSPKLVVENNDHFIISWFWWIRNVDKVEWGEVAQMTEGDRDNTIGDISLGSSFLPHVASPRVEMPKIACSLTGLRLELEWLEYCFHPDSLCMAYAPHMAFAG